jgi:putative acetyltransferase
MPPTTPADLSVRRGRSEDAQPIHELSLRALQQSAARHYTAAELEEWASLRSPAGHLRMIDETYLLVAEQSGRLCGFANVELDTGLVDQLFVDPSAGGRGVATSLLAAIESQARAAGLGQLTAHASRRAVSVFERCGYERLETEHVTIGDETLERFRVRKVLSLDAGD